MTKTTAPPLSDVARLSVTNASSCTSGNRDAGSWLAAAGRRGTGCQRAFRVAVTGISPRSPVGSASRCRRASSTLVRDGSRPAFCRVRAATGTRGACLGPQPQFHGSKNHRAKPRRCGCSGRSRLPRQTSRPGLARIRRTRSTSRPRPKVRQYSQLSVAMISGKWRCISHAIWQAPNSQGECNGEIETSNGGRLCHLPSRPAARTPDPTAPTVKSVRGADPEGTPSCREHGGRTIFRTSEASRNPRTLVPSRASPATGRRRLSTGRTWT